MTILATSATLEGITKCLESYYCGTKIAVYERGQVIRLSDNKMIEGVRVIRKGKRYRFETVESSK